MGDTKLKVHVEGVSIYSKCSGCHFSFFRRGAFVSSKGAPVPWHSGTMASPRLINLMLSCVYCLFVRSLFIFRLPEMVNKDEYNYIKKVQVRDAP